MIVSVMRFDLRDEIADETAMANEAFALSPMSARAAQPNEADYDAISEAFMETARGRWFLGEYAKRNRNADTRMVLDAVAKIEETIAAQRQPVVIDRLPEALAAIRRAVADAETTATAAFDPATLGTRVAPIDRGLRIIREISWRWREIGADGRICDLIDSQLAAIESACAEITAVDPRPELKAAFDLLRDRIAETDGGETAASQPAAARSAAAAEAPTVAEAAPVVAEAATVASEPPTVAAEMPEPVAAAPAPEAMVAPEALSDTMDVVEASAPTVETDIAEFAESHPAIDEAMVEPIAANEVMDEFPLDAAADAEDEAVLARIALEMAAPDPDFDEVFDAPPEVAAAHQEPMAQEPVMNEPALQEPVAPEPMAIEEAPVMEEPVMDEPVAATPLPAESFAQLREAIAEAAVAVMERPAAQIAPEMMQATSLPMPSPVAETAFQTSSEQSLGATILASGMLQKPRAANDPLGPIRRMTQAEKIAFFS